ncbi:hypothetical protein RJF_1857 [Candidozyma auris]|nr:hypothetical protein B9J08_001507 [[Candida] auris]
MFWVPQGLALISPIKVHGRYFFDSVTQEPFYIKGVDYQPGGSSVTSQNKDPLSDPDICARDIALFQQLGINTIRVYTVNPDLDHDVCMTLLASAGIYLVLDVNSPQQARHLNRYEPWSTYTAEYLQNVFKVVEQFGNYNNTLGFFAGNEIVNDKISAAHSPRFVKAMVRDIKQYIDASLARKIPVGYSAADDLDYRIPLSEYLECIDESPFDSADFYGVNSYQWCGDQTFYSSGYDKLVSDYADYTRPVFLSEYGCNKVTPRMFSEVQALYSDDMIGVFSGGLAYEFSQEPNNYGLVKVLDNGDVILLDDFLALKYQLETVPDINYDVVTHHLLSENMKGSVAKHDYKQPTCKSEFRNLAVEQGLPSSVADKLVDQGVDVKKGKYVTLTESQLQSSYKVFSPSGKALGTPTVRVIRDISPGSSSRGSRLPVQTIPNSGTYGVHHCHRPCIKSRKIY